MPDTSQARRQLRAQIATHTRLGRTDEAAAARTALAVQHARERINGLTSAAPPPPVEHVDLLDDAVASVRAWAAEQASTAPPIDPAAARAIATALRGGGDA